MSDNIEILYKKIMSKVNNIKKEGCERVLTGVNSIKNYSNDLVIEKYLSFYRHSKQSVKSRKSCLRYFFGSKYFGFNYNVYEINKVDLIILTLIIF